MRSYYPYRRKSKWKSALPFVLAGIVLIAVAVTIFFLLNRTAVPASAPVASSSSEASSETSSEAPPSSAESSGNPVSSQASSAPAVDESNYVAYTGPIEHIFFHPLVAYPELAFDGDAQAKGMDDYMTTATEFQRVLEELYRNDYILVDPSQLYGEPDESDDSGKTYVKKTLKLPPGKKPVIISVDDVNYYDYMRENGCNYKLVVGSDGHIAAMVKNPQTGKEEIRTDTEVFPMINEFLKKHPDFSYRGAKAVVGLTGYSGILGYRTQVGSPNRESEIEAVKPVIECLKRDGFTFASHSYAHGHMSKKGVDYMTNDCQMWKDEVESLVGKTNVYLFPYGEYPKIGSEPFNVLLQYGFQHISGVGINVYQKMYDGYLFNDRKNIDGITLRKCLEQGPDYIKPNGKEAVQNQVWDMMDVEYVFDKCRGDTPGEGSF
ncbi:polysaccharide deacetylase family protein [Solibaculum mannosilyticum]|uniref:polysaccharide deacetylase family protein n=1 Tax=Solibaculum mannosilyticum TaxID=2780922 RepID=UPI000C074A3F|nr:polysaccharide deacetylase family protein [[Clostridium] leptum]